MAYDPSTKIVDRQIAKSGITTQQASVHKFLYHKDFSHMSIDIFHESATPELVLFKVRSAEVEFLGSRRIADGETLLRTINECIMAAGKQLAETVIAQKDALIAAGGQIQ